MSDLVTTLTERGQISIPAKIRRKLHLSPGDKLHWEEVSPNECRLVVQRDAEPVGAEAMLGYARQFRETKRTAEWMAELRAGDRG